MPLGVLHALQRLLHGYVCGRNRGGHQYFSNLHSTAHLPSPMSYPVPQSLDPSAPGSGLILGSPPAGGQQQLPAPTFERPGGIRCNVRWPGGGLA